MLWADPELAGPWYHFVCLMIYLGINKGKHRDVSGANEGEMRAAYEEHYARIRKACPPDRMLTIGLGDGWFRLCKFLGHAVPDKPYPKVNDRAFFIEFRVRMLKRATFWAAQKILIWSLSFAFVVFQCSLLYVVFWN